MIRIQQFLGGGFKSWTATRRETLLNVIAGLLAALFFYAAMSKLIDYEAAKRGMLGQVFARTVALMLAWLVPLFELLTVCFLVYTPTRRIGLWISFLLMFAFTAYTGTIMTGFFGAVPCSCGGILKSMPHHVHLIFNLSFFLLSSVGLLLERGKYPKKQWSHLFKRKEVNAM